jgi:hypothetical protein
MYAFLASLIFVAAGEVAPPPPPTLPDTEVVRYLKPVELIEWNNALRITSAGLARVKVGQSIQATSGTAAARNGPKVGGLTETPEQVKARTQKIVDEGNAQIEKASPSLVRLRSLASMRAAELVKPVTFEVDCVQKPWDVAVAQSAASIQKFARNAGYSQVHLVGSFALIGGKELTRPATLTSAIRSACTKADGLLLAAAPAEGYLYQPIAGQVAPSMSKGGKPAAAQRQSALLWGEFYSLSSDGTMGVLFLRLADAYTMRIIASEATFTVIDSVGPIKAPITCTLSLQDSRSFIPRLSTSDWILGFENDSNPLGSAIIAHLCAAQTGLSVSAGPYLMIVTKGGRPGPDGVRVKWRAAPATTDGSHLAFDVSGQIEGASPVDVGLLTLKIALPAPPK